jgi:hypothetical protein
MVHQTPVVRNDLILAHCYCFHNETNCYCFHNETDKLQTPEVICIDAFAPHSGLYLSWPLIVNDITIASDKYENKK